MPYRGRVQVTFSLPKHAARQSGPEEKYAEAFSPMGSAELWAVPRHKALERKILYQQDFSLFFLVGIRICKGTAPDRLGEEC